MLRWRFAPFDELTPREVHDLYQARVGVFVLEQSCPFQDVDGADPASWHLIGRAADSAEGGLLAYCRLVPAGVKFAEPSIGRVLTTSEGRRMGLGRELMHEALRRAGELWPGADIRIGAQAYLDRFYGEFGFVKASEPYDEDGIIHIEMLRAARK
jgi:ElaA protein